MAGTRIDTVLFDLDGTICDYRRPGSEVLSDAFEEMGVEPYFGIEDYLERIRALDSSSSSFDELRRKCFAELSRDSGRDPDLGREIASAYADRRDQTNVQFCPGAAKAIEALGERYPLGVVTNAGPDLQRPKIEALEINESFDTIVFAGYETPSKPDPTPFHHALESLESSPDRSVHIGNSLRDDVAGAKQAGVASVWISDGRDPDPVPDYEVESLEQLVDPPWE